MHAGHGFGSFGDHFRGRWPGVYFLREPVQNAPTVVTAQNGQAVRAYVTQSSHGTWLFPPHQGGNG